MRHVFTIRHTRRAAVAILVSLAATITAATGSAANSTWISATTGGNWSTTTNWNPTGAPTTGDTANLNDATTSRVVTYDASASGALGTLSFTQSSNATNELKVQRDLSVTTGITIGASSGTSRIYVLPSGATNINLGSSAGISVSSGGLLSLGVFNPAATTTLAYGIVNVGSVTVSGGVLEAADTVKNGTATATAISLISNHLTMTSGTLAFSNSGYNARRLQISGTAGITGGAVTTQAGSAELWLNSTTGTSTLAPASFDTRISTILGGNGDQGLAAGLTLGTVIARGFGTKVVSTTSGTVGQIQIMDSTATAGVGTTLKLASNMTATSNPIPTSFSNTGESGRIDLGVNAASYTLTLTSGWTPGASTQAGITNTVWNLSGTTGTIKATQFTFNSGTTTVNVAAGLTLTSTGGNSASNVLSGAGTIDATSTFRYAGTAGAATPATLVSTRSIGDLEVTSGVLRVTGLSGAQNLRVAGGMLDLNAASQAFSSVTLTGGTLASGTVTSSGAIAVQAGSVSAALGGAGGLTKTGGGTVTLSAANTYLGATAVSAGGLVINGSLANAGGLSVAAGAWLSGTGSISNLSTVSGTLAPGGGTGVMQLGSLTLTSSAATLIDIAGASRGVSYDGIDILNGSGLTYGGTLAFAFTNVLPDNTTLNIFDFTGSSGGFTALVSTGSYVGTWSALGGGMWQSTQGGQTLTFSESTGDLVIVPEPIVGVATVGLACLVFASRASRRLGSARHGG